MIRPTKHHAAVSAQATGPALWDAFTGTGDQAQAAGPGPGNCVQEGSQNAHLLYPNFDTIRLYSRLKMKLTDVGRRVLHPKDHALTAWKTAQSFFPEELEVCSKTVLTVYAYIKAQFFNYRTGKEFFRVSS